MPLKTIKLAISDEMITQLDSRAAIEGMPRSELIRRTLSGQLHPAVIENYPRTCAEVLRATNGKLSRAEVDHLVSVVIKGMAASSTK
jgi:metal-responsive CopG/Arc/MetJ family transcriptional regulator